MTRFFTLAVAAFLAAAIGTNAWSQGGQSGGGGTSGSAGASGSAGTSGSADATGTAGAAGTTGTAGAAGTAGASGAAPGSTGTGATGTTGAAGTAPAASGSNVPGTARTTGVGTGARNPSNVPGQRQFGTAPQPGFNFDGFGQTPFFADPGVRQQLNLNDAQFNQLNQARMDALNRFNQRSMALGTNLTEEQRMQQMQQLEAQFNQDFGQSLDSTFTDPRMRQRFNQLNTQFRGFNSFNDPDLRRQLNLTAAQRRQLQRLNAAWRQRLQQLRRAGNDNQQLTDEQFAQLQAQNLEQINSILTPEQQVVWSQAVGQPFPFPRRVFIPDPDNISGGLPPVPGGQRSTGIVEPFGPRNAAQARQQNAVRARQNAAQARQQSAAQAGQTGQQNTGQQNSTQQSGQQSSGTTTR